MAENVVAKLESIINSNEDIMKCRDYRFRISNGDHSCINEALAFANQKYDELFLTDADVVIVRDIRKISNPQDEYYIQRTLNSISCIEDLLINKIKKEILFK